MARREALGKGVGALFSEPIDQEKLPESEVITEKSGVISKAPSATQAEEVISKESGVVSKESEVITHESGVISKAPSTTQREEVISKESGVVSNESEVITHELGVISKTPSTTQREEVISKESGVVSKESEVITHESGVISKAASTTQAEEVISKESGVISKELEVITSDKRKKEKRTSESRRPKNRQHSPAVRISQTTEQVNQEVLEQAIAEALKSPRISTWSPLVMSALRYLQLTKARFSMSKEVSETLEEAFREKYPDLFERIEKEIEVR